MNVSSLAASVFSLFAFSFIVADNGSREENKPSLLISRLCAYTHHTIQNRWSQGLSTTLQGYLKVRREPSKRRTADQGWASKMCICLGTLETPRKSSTANRKLLRRARMRGASPLRTCE